MDRTAPPDRRNLAARDEASTQRQRSVLAALLSVVDSGEELDLADKLLQEFGSIDRILAQSPEALNRVAGTCTSASTLLLGARDLTTEALRFNLPMRRLDPFDSGFRRYLILSMGSLPDETLRIFFLDGAHRLIADEQLQRGALTTLALYPRTLFRRALEHNAAAVLLVHNHPSGDPEPSREDLEATRQLARIGRALEVDLLDHLVITRTEVFHIVKGARGDARTAGAAGCTLRSSEPSPDANDKRAHDNALRTMRRRLLRRQIMGAEELFGEPAWDMLIDLFVHECQSKQLSTSSLSIATEASMSSAVRLVRRLCDAGLVVREPDPDDGRRTFIRLTPDTVHRMCAYFGAATVTDA